MPRRAELALAVALTTAALAGGCSALEGSEADRQRASAAANEAFARRVPDGGCVNGMIIDFAMDAVDDEIGQAAANAGWVSEHLFIGSLDAMAASVGASFVAEAGGEAWVVAERDGPRLLHVIERGNVLKRAYLVTEVNRRC